MQRKFLGWHKPLLHLTADYLLEHHTVDGRLDLKSVSLVMPGRRAWHRLEEILASRAQEMHDPAWYPPEFMTLHSLPERFYKLQKQVAGTTTRCFAWIKAIEELRKIDGNLVQQLLPGIPERFDAQLALGRLLTGLHDDLAAEGVDFRQVAEACNEIGAAGEIPRWEALARLREIYANEKGTGILDKLDLWDLQLARLYAIDRQTKEGETKIRERLRKENRRFYLVGLVDMNELQKRILKKYGEFITPLVFAPPKDKSVRETFDEFGCLKPDDWFDMKFDIDDRKNVRVVWQPEQQADAVLEKIDSIEKRYASSEIVVGVQDKQVVPYVQQRLIQAGLSSHLLEGGTIRQSRPFRLLESLLKFLKSRRFRDYAEWIRHPDVESFLFGELKQKFEHVHLVDQLDEYYNKFYPVEVEDEWKSYVDPTNEKRNKYFRELRECWTIVKELVADLPDVGTNEEKPLAEGLTAIEKILKRIYPSGGSGRTRKSVERIRSVSGSLREIPVTDAGRFSFVETLELLLVEVESERLPTDKKPKDVELIGWLEIPMDDAPVVIVTGMNDGVIPSFSNADIFLPDRLRKRLGLMDNRRRGARDAYNLTVLMNTRKNRGDFQLIAGRRSGEGDPMLPSRFFFASNDTETVVRRVKDFFIDEQPPTVFELDNSVVKKLAKEHRFEIPALPNPSRPVSYVSVSELKDFVKCPYRYYLSRRMRLQAVDDVAQEMQAFDFGNLVHEVLRQFGLSEFKDSTSPETIRKFLHRSIDDFSRERYGNRPRAAISIQVRRAKARLDVWALRQAEWRGKGYRIENVEFGPETAVRLSTLELRGKTDPSAIELHGQIDRIDRHETTGEIVILDYKTGSYQSGSSDPEKTHRGKDGRWIDFQLPLYAYLLRKSNYPGLKEPVTLGYVAIPNDLEDIGVKLAQWSRKDVQENAWGEAARILEAIQGDWSTVLPNPDPPPYSEAFDFICQSLSERKAVFKASL